ncbi:hypothetical protein L1987_81011 [Smallanthus sonchifolius]|uniref:Uncharacterized protein n=1 Tax=Smallanthus sonchifolius TaxID=185202 RepID=A0ACB8YPZ5_9ASTR|nr:hypothetical protein L1987_81011 [Smallanthus sonchifolius]
MWYQSLLEKGKKTVNKEDQSQSSATLNQRRNRVKGRNQDEIVNQGRRFKPENEKGRITRGLANLTLDRGVKPVRMKMVGSTMVRGRIPVVKRQGYEVEFVGDVCYVMGMFDDNENMEPMAEIDAQIDPLNGNDLDIKKTKGRILFERMGGSDKISSNNKWVEVTSKLGFSDYIDVKLRVRYMKYFDLIDCYNATVIGNKNLIGEQDQVDEVLVQERVGRLEMEAKGCEYQEGYLLMCSPSSVIAGSKNAQDEDNIETEPSIEEYYEVDYDAAMLGSEESKMQTGYETDKDDSSDDDVVIILN